MTVRRFPIEEGHVLMFARSIGDFNPVFHDHEAATAAGFEGIIAPPTFVQASAQFDPDYPLRPKAHEPWMGSGREATSKPSPAGEPQTGTTLHAEQHFEYHRPVRVGDVLSAETRQGAVWEKQGRRGGKMSFSEQIVEYKDEVGEPVVTARVVAVTMAPEGES